MIRAFNNIILSERNSFHINAVARELIEYSSADDLVDIFTSSPPNSWMVLSGGNNILFTQDVDTTILTPTDLSIDVFESDEDSVTIKVSSGVEWDNVVEWCVERDLWGAENLSLIPGYAGAAPIQNIGAYGCEVKDILDSVEYFDTVDLAIKSIDATDCKFGYRKSIFKHELKGRAIVTAIYLKLSRVASPQLRYADLISRVAELGEPTLRNIRKVICEIRGEKLPDTSKLGNAGSFFKNPIVGVDVAERLKRDYPNMPIYPVANDASVVKLAAGWLIDNAGMKGYRSGNVGVHDRQALVLVNHGGATGAEVLALAREVQQKVFEHFGVAIDTEVNIL